MSMQSKSIAAGQEQFWAMRLIEYMNTMGEQHTNAVLLSLHGADSIIPYQRYPETPYYFGNNLWRAFYHCHDSPDKSAEEHGHYHFFTRQDKQDEWCHVVAMNMNTVGQPIGLFTTNLWVTDGKWFSSSQLLSQIAVLENSQDDDLAAQWFKCFLMLYQFDILELLISRDNKIDGLFPDNHEHCFSDRNVYCLSEVRVNLNKQLLDILSPQH